MSPGCRGHEASGGIVAGDLLLVGGSLDGPVPTTFSVADSMGNSFTPISTGVAAPFVVYLEYAYAKDAVSRPSARRSTRRRDVHADPVLDFGGIAPSGFDTACTGRRQSLATDAVATRALDVSAANELVFGWRPST